MKYLMLSVMLTGIVFMLKAQSNKTLPDYYWQKQLLDSLRSAHKQPAIKLYPKNLLVYNEPSYQLPNEGEKIGLSGEDTIYRMKTDNMLLLKPNQNITYIPNATEGKVFICPPAKKKP